MAGFDLRGLTVTPLRYQFDTWDNFYDANWLIVRIALKTAGVSAEFEDPCLMTRDLLRFADEISDLLAHEADTAKLEPLEPELRIVIRCADDLGHFIAAVDISPPPPVQSIRLAFDIDRTDVAGVSQALRTTLAAFPVRDLRGASA